LLTGESQYFPGPLPADVKTLMDQARTETDPAARTKVLQDLAAAVHENELLGVISTALRPAAALPSVVNFQGLTHVIAELRGTGLAAW
jgi:hypothetical protein